MSLDTYRRARPGTAKARVERLLRVYEDGGEEALLEFARTSPTEYIEAIEAIYIVEGDDEGLEEYQAEVSAICRDVVERLITQDGFTVFDEMVRLARENGMDDRTDEMEAQLKRMRN